MSKAAILLMAGSGQRTGLKENKTRYLINNIPLYIYSLKVLSECNFDKIYLVVSENDYEDIVKECEESCFNPIIVKGGNTRNESVKNALKLIKEDYTFIHDAARPMLLKEDLEKLIEASNEYLIGTLYHPIFDTVRLVKENDVETIDRNNLYAISTPQFFNKKLYNDILENEKEITDEVSLFENKQKIAFIKESKPNIKFTTIQDLEQIKFRIIGNKEYYIGNSLDYHPFTTRRSLTLGGVKIDYKGLDGHSDADVVYHVVAESIMGATELGDLGTLYPDNTSEFKDFDSSYFVKDVVNRAKEKGYSINNIDVMIYLINPRLKDYKKQMAKNIKDLTGAINVTVKAATLNKKGLISLEEGIGAEATVLCSKQL